MSRNFTPDQSLIDQLRLDDSTAFEELYQRYSIFLYSYCANKLHNTDDAKKIVRDVYVSLWENRHVFPADFSISLHFYLEVRKAVIKCLNEKLIQQHDLNTIESKIIPGFDSSILQQAKEPVKQQPYSPVAAFSAVEKSKILSPHEPWWKQYFPAINLRGIRYTFQRVMHLW